MARNDQFGALGSLTPDQYSNLSLGFDMTNPTGLSLGGIGVNKGSAIGYALGFAPTPASVMGTIGRGMASYNAEKAAQSALGQNKGFMDTVTGMINNPSLDTARGLADTNKDKSISDREAKNFGMQYGKMTAYNVGLDPMAGYTPNSVSIQGLAPFGKADPDAGLGGINTTGQVADVMTQQQVDDMFSGIDTTSGVTGLGGGKGASYSGVSNFSPTEGVDTDDPESSGSTGVGVSNVDAMGNTATTGGISFSDDAQSSGTGPGDSTYICTALYEMGDMKKYIYKYDQVYGKIVDPYVYRGYCTWGKYVATKMRDKGIVYKITKPLALAWAKQMAFDLSKGRYGKNNKVVKVVSRIGESICYALGVVANIKLKKGVKYG